MSEIHLNDLSKIYLDQISEKKKDDSYLETDMKKRQANNEKARKEMEKISGQKNPHFEEKQLDPVGQEDSDIDNDGDVDKSDKYLGKRRKAIAKAMKKRMKKEEVEQVIEGDGDPCWDSHKQVGMKKKGKRMVPNCVPKNKVSEQEEKIGSNLKSLAKNATKRIDADVDGDVDTDDPKSTEMGEFVPSVDGKKKLKPKVQKETYSNWRSDLIEVIDTEDPKEKQIKEKKVNNKIKINPKLGEEVVSEMGGTLIEMVEYDEFDGMVEGVYFELQEEGYAEGDIEEALEWVLTEAKVTYGHDTESPRQQMMKKAKGRLKFMKRKAGEALSSAKKKVGEKITSAKKDAAQAQVDAYNKGRELKQKAGDKVRGKKAGIKAKIKRVAQKVVDRMSEETEDPKEKQMLAKKKQMMMKQQMLDKQRMQAQMQGKLPSGHRVEQKEEMSVKDQMRISREYNRMSPEEKKAVVKKAVAGIKKVAVKKDTRTDAEKMADATGPRPGSRYRGD